MLCTVSRDMFSPIFHPSEKPERCGWYVCSEIFEIASECRKYADWLSDGAMFYWYDTTSEQWYVSDLMLLEAYYQDRCGQRSRNVTAWPGCRGKFLIDRQRWPRFFGTGSV